MLYICIFSNKFDLIQAICVSHTLFYYNTFLFAVVKRFYKTGPTREHSNDKKCRRVATVIKTALRYWERPNYIFSLRFKGEKIGATIVGPREH